MGLPADTGIRSLPTSSPNLYGRVVAVFLMCVGTTASVSSMPPRYLMVSLVESLDMSKSPLPQPILCGIYTPPGNFPMPLSGSVPHSGCGLLRCGGPL